MSDPADVFQQLMAVIEDRWTKRPPDSYTTRLFAGGVQKMGAKVVEEARESVEAAAELETLLAAAPPEAGTASVEVDAKRAHLVYEAGDLIYHLFVLLAAHQISLDDVAGELSRRFGTSGLAEKAARSSQPKS